MPSVPSSTPSTNDNLPSGLDRADGLAGRIGTPTPANAVKKSGPLSGAIEEDPESPIIARAEQCTSKKRYNFRNYEDALAYWQVYPRGTLKVDTGGNYFRVLNADISHKRGDLATLDLVSEAMSFDSPPDEYRCVPVKLGLDIMKHPRYFYALMPTNQIPKPWPPNVVADSAIQSAVKSTIIRAIQAYRENPLVPPSGFFQNVSGYYHDLIVANFITGAGIYPVPNPNFQPQWAATTPDPVGTNYSGNPYPAAATGNGQPNPPLYYAAFNLATGGSDPNGNVALSLAAAQELIAKIWRMEDTPLINGWEITHSEWHTVPPPLNPGSYIEDPRDAVPPLPDFFYSTSFPPDPTQTIFDQMSYFNPQCYSLDGKWGGGTSISWLRDADAHEFQRTRTKVTRRWLGAVLGAWDAQLYLAGSSSGLGNRPSKPGDYVQLYWV